MAKNLYHLTIVAHPTTVLALHMVAAARYFVQNNAPFRVGVIFVDEEGADVVPASASVSGKEKEEDEESKEADSAKTDASWPTDLLPAATWAEFMPPTASAASKSSSSKSTTKSSASSSSSSGASASASAASGVSATHHPLPTLMAAAFRYLAEVHAATTAFAFLDAFKHEHVTAKLDEANVRRAFLDFS